MKIQNAIRVQLLVAGLGAALLLPGTVRAQQDMDPTTFDVNPGTPQVENAPVVQAQNVTPGPRAEAQKVATADFSVVGNADTADGWILFTVMSFAGGIALRWIAQARRQRMLQSAS